MAKKRVLVLGCTGSIGSQTLDIIRNEKDLLEAKSEIDRMKSELISLYRK